MTLEDEGSTILRNVGNHSPDTVSLPTRTDVSSPRVLGSQSGICIRCISHKERTFYMAGCYENCDELSVFMIRTERLLAIPQGLHCVRQPTVPITYSTLKLRNNRLLSHSFEFSIRPATRLCVSRGWRLSPVVYPVTSAQRTSYERSLLPALLHKPQTNEQTNKQTKQVTSSFRRWLPVSQRFWRLSSSI
jgi:hypothetical protein